MEMIDIITRLRQQQQGMLRKGEFAFINRSDIVELLTLVDALRAERDEARRLYCIAFQEITKNLGEKNTTESIAEEMGWDCFKENA